MLVSRDTCDKMALGEDDIPEEDICEIKINARSNNSDVKKNRITCLNKIVEVGKRNKSIRLEENY